MTEYERLILEAFANKYGSSSAARGGKNLRLRGLSPDAAVSGPDKVESFLEAAESLEREGIARIVWARRRKGESIEAIEVIAAEKAFGKLGLSAPDRIAKRAAAVAREEAGLARDCGDAATADFFDFIASSLGPEDGAAGIDERFVRDLASLCSVSLSSQEGSTPRALSVRLFSDSKRIEAILPSAKRFAERSRRAGRFAPDINAVERSFPETSIGGDATLRFDDGRRWDLGRMPVGLSLSVASRVAAVEPSPGRGARALSIENKETFYAFFRDLAQFDCIVYTGGHVNPAVSSIIRTLAISGYSISHAGDLDPDGLLILEEVARSAEAPVAPHRMDVATFDEYARYARPIGASVVSRLDRLDQKTLALDGIPALVNRIRETSSGIEQEVITY